MSCFRIRHILLAACTAALLGLSGSASAQAERDANIADAPAGSVRLLVSGGVLAPILKVRPELEKATGRKIFVQASESRKLQQVIESGQPFEAAVLTTAVIKDMIAKGRITTGSNAVVGALLMGVSARGAIPQQDVSTTEGLKAAVLGAYSIRRFYGVAASTPIIENLFAKLDLNEATKDRMVALGSGAPPPENPLPPGRYELIINLVSAIKPMKGWTYLGLIPSQFQMPVEHSAAVGAAGDQEAGRKVVEVLRGPAFKTALKDFGG